MNIFKFLGTKCAIKLKLAIVAHQAFATMPTRKRRRRADIDEMEAKVSVDGGGERAGYRRQLESSVLS